ncbi:MAG TPA: hypothetical protein VLG69_00705 [Candidatus Andersenbacteria bacterium]|nr:hypothetical protein [Candidatus Andersenbacteria bacterium]
MEYTFFVPCDGLFGRDCFVTVQIIPGKPVKTIQRHPSIPQEIVNRQLIKILGLA